ncbi:hypothetical protein ABPG74_007400 [Tetrahymena malaccensis]
MIATFGDKQINNQQVDHMSYQKRTQLGNSTGSQQKDIQQIYQFDSGKIQNPYYIDQNQFKPTNNNFNNNFITQNIDFQYKQDDKANYAPKMFPDKDKYLLGGNLYQQKGNNYANNEGDIAIMMNSSIQSAHSQQIINNDISDEENERRLANNFQISGSSLSPDFKIDTVKSSNLHNTSNNLKKKDQHLQDQEINQWKDEQFGYEEQNEQKRNCDSCHVIPANYIALPCTHNFCISCLMKIYMNPMLCRKDYDNFAELVCQICSKPTKLDYESQIAIETEIQQLLINSMNDQNPLQMISNPNLQLEDNNQQASREDLNSSENQEHKSLKEQIQKKDANQFQSANNYLQMYDQQNQDNQQQQQQVQQYFQQRYQMPKEEVIHEEESMETFLTNETHKLIHFNSSDSPYQSLPKSSFQNKQHLTKSAYSSNQASQSGNILTNSLLKVLHNNNGNQNNVEKNNLQNLQNIQPIQFSDFKKSLENYNNENRFLQFQNEDQEFQVKNLMLTEESGGVESEKKNISGISPIASNNNKNQQNVLKTESEQNQDISNNNILEFRRVESDLSDQGNDILDQEYQQGNDSVVINREKPQFIQSQYIAEDKANLVHSNVRLLNSIQQSKDLAHLNQIYSQNLKKQETQTPYTPSDLNLLHSIQQSQDLQSSYQTNSQKVSKMETPAFNPQNLHLLHSIQQSKDLQNFSLQNSNQNQQPNLNQVNSVHSNIQLLHSIQDISSSASNKFSQKQNNSLNSTDNKFLQVKEQIKQVNSSNLIPGEDSSYQNQKRNLLVSEYIPMEKEDQSIVAPQIQPSNSKENISQSQQNSYMRLTQTNKNVGNINLQQQQSSQDKEQNPQNQNSIQQAQPQSLNSSSQASKQDQNTNKKLLSSKISEQEQNQQQLQKQTQQSSQNNYDNKFLRTREQIKSGGKISYRSSRNSKSESMSENQLMQSLESNNINALSTNCNEHPLEDAQLFCFTCECKCICLACQADSIKHNGHQVEYVTRSYDILKMRLQETHQDISNKIELMDSTYWNFSQQKINVQKKNEEMQQQIFQTFNSLRDLLKLKENELLQQLSQHQANALQIVDQECNKMQEARKTLETVSGKLNIIQNAQPSELVELSDCTITFNYYAECKRILNEIISKTKIDQEPIKQFENISLGIVQQIADQVKICINEIKFPQPQRDLRLSPQSNRLISNNLQLNNYTPQHQSITTIDEVINQNGNQISNQNKLNQQNKSEISQKSKESLANLESIAKFKQILHNNSTTQKNINNTNQNLLDRKDLQTPSTKYQLQSNLEMQYQQPNQDVKLMNNFANENGYNTSESQRNQINIEPTKSNNNSYFLYNNSARSNQPKSQNGGYFLSTNTDQSDKQVLSSINKLKNQNNFSPCSVDNSKMIDQIEQRNDAFQIASADQNRNSIDLKDNLDVKHYIQNQQESGYASKIQQSYPKLKISSNHLQDEIDKINNSLFELQANIDLNTIFCRTENSPLKEKNEYLINYSERQQKLNSNRIAKKSSPSHYHSQQINTSSLNSLKSSVLSPTTASSIQKFFKNFQQKYDQKSGQPTNNTQQNFAIKNNNNNNNNNNSEGRQTNNLKLSNSIFSYSKKINEQNQNSSVQKEIRSKYQHHKHLSDIKLNSISISNDASNQSNILSPKPLLKDLDFQLYSNKSNKEINFNFNSNITTQQPSDNMLYLPEQSVIEKLSAFQQDIKNSSIFQKELRMKEIDWMKSKTITLLKKSETHFQSQHALNEQDQPNYVQKSSITPNNYRSNSNINLSKLSINSTANQFNTSSNSQYIQNNNYHSEGRQSCLSSNNNLRSITPQQSSPTANYFNKATYNSSKQNINNYQSGQYQQKRLQKPKSFTSRNLLSMFDKSPSNNFLVLNQEKVMGEAKHQIKNFGNNHQNLIESYNMINGNLNMNNNNNSLI